MKEKTSDIVPDQQTGRAIDAETNVVFNAEEDAKAFFFKVRERLQNVNRWKEYAGNLSASFQLIDKNGIEVQRKPQKGDYFKIDIPGPGTESGNGYDWVQIEDVENTSTPDAELFGFRVRPTHNPGTQEQDVAHFYSHESTSSFIVERNHNKITVSIFDRNIKPNTDDADRIMDKIRNAVVGTAGVISFSKIQWQKLTDGLASQQ